MLSPLYSTRIWAGIVALSSTAMLANMESWVTPQAVVQYLIMATAVIGYIAQTRRDNRFRKWENQDREARSHNAERREQKLDTIEQKVDQAGKEIKEELAPITEAAKKIGNDSGAPIPSSRGQLKDMIKDVLMEAMIEIKSQPAKPSSPERANRPDPDANKGPKNDPVR